MNYVVGFAFSQSLAHLLLIKKNRPDWQKGLHNGIGGKVADGEDPIFAMAREFKEESGLDIIQWRLFHKETFESGNTVYFFSTRTDSVYEARSPTDEEVVVCPTMQLPNNVVYNVPYLIPMALVLMTQLPANRPVIDAKSKQP